MQLTYINPQLFQTTLLQSFFPTLKTLKLTVHHDPLAFNRYEDDLIRFNRIKIRTASEFNLTGVLITTCSVILFRKSVYLSPKFKMTALERLRSFSGKSHQLVTAWLIKNNQTEKEITGMATTKVYLNELIKKNLENFINDHDVIHTVGGYQPLDPDTLPLIHRIDGSLTNFLYNLPLDQILPVLKREIKL